MQVETVIGMEFKGFPNRVQFPTISVNRKLTTSVMLRSSLLIPT